MVPPQDTSEHISGDGGESSRASSSALLKTEQLVGDTETSDAAWEVNTVAEEVPPPREAPIAPLQAEGRPPTIFKWNFNLESDTPGTLLPLPPSRLT